jgi:HlyD family secretion protein
LRSEYGDSAVTGLAAPECHFEPGGKGFKVVIALDDPPAEIRPGLSCTSKITTANRAKALSIPIQALTIRQKGALLPDKERAGRHHAPPSGEGTEGRDQGVFVVAGGKAVFRKVVTGITGSSILNCSKG